jgi:N-acetylmuramoyl-L-alanine amidase
MPAPVIHDRALPYVANLRERALADIDLVVIHCTELPDLATAREYGERVLHGDGTGNSGHYYVDRDGALHRFVANNRVAHHTRGYNERSLGIELVNTGRWPDWFDSQKQAMGEPYPAVQIAALLSLLQLLRADCPNLQWIAGHEDLDTGTVPASDDPSLQVFRKRDPGPMFPWNEVLRACGLSRMPG